MAADKRQRQQEQATAAKAGNKNTARAKAAAETVARITDQLVELGEHLDLIFNGACCHAVQSCCHIVTSYALRAPPWASSIGACSCSQCVCLLYAVLLYRCVRASVPRRLARGANSRPVPIRYVNHYLFKTRNSLRVAVDLIPRSWPSGRSNCRTLHPTLSPMVPGVTHVSDPPCPQPLGCCSGPNGFSRTGS